MNTVIQDFESCKLKDYKCDLNIISDTSVKMSLNLDQSWNLTLPC